ncbi:hypothetical protein [Agathobacter rectalis]|jgi:hypothetical protein|uniref:Uncharacterized protein n=1 Tax=Agathobacter rectalis TaxID=39491 RepID=A0A173TRP5_9FIRM|nr:hypothetical protein [Agathobacter rectalis]CUN04990.1 Uncharacterised protein [Agathobacter rectalis]
MTQKRLDNISEGIDFKGYKIKHRYYYDNEKNFIIFEDDKGNVQYLAEKQITNISTLLGKCNLMKELVKDKKSKQWINAQKAAALNEFFCENEDESKKILEDCIKNIEDKELIKKKCYYIGVYLGVTVLILAIVVIIKWLFPNFKYINYGYIVLFGAFGGFISLNTRLPKIKFELYENIVAYVVVSFYKVIFSCVSSIIAYFLLQSDMFFSPLKNTEGAIYVVAVLAGFSESLLPNIFASIENDSST